MKKLFLLLLVVFLLSHVAVARPIKVGDKVKLHDGTVAVVMGKGRNVLCLRTEEKVLSSDWAEGGGHVHVRPKEIKKIK